MCSSSYEYLLLLSRATWLPKGGIRKRITSTLEKPEVTEWTHKKCKLSTSLIEHGVPSRSGRVRRRLEKTAPTCGGEIEEKLLLQNLKREWGRGKLSSSQVQDYSAGAAEQGARGLGKVAAAGSKGCHPQNLQRSLISVFGMPTRAPEFWWHEIPLKAGLVKHPFLLPHMWFASLHTCCSQMWSSSIQGPEGSAETFWASIRESAFIKSHPFFCQIRPERSHSCTATEGVFQTRFFVCVYMEFSVRNGFDDEEEIRVHCREEVGHGSKHHR